MAILESCCGCGLAVSSAVLGVYLLVAYSIAFAIELWWILDSPVAQDDIVNFIGTVLPFAVPRVSIALVTPPIPAYLLCLGYLILLVFSALLLHGLSVKRTTYLLIWLFMMGIFLGPEAGLVLYLSIHYWRVTSMYGLIEITCWACRLIVNIVGLLCVQSLHSVWREEKSVLLKLETLKTSPPSKAQGRRLNNSIFRGYENSSYEQNEASLGGAQEKPEGNSYACFGSSPNGFVFKDEAYDGNYIDECYVNGSEFSEFNASSFDPTVIDARLESMPYLTIRKKPPKTTEAAAFISNESNNLSKTRSLIDFRDAGLFEEGKINHVNKEKFSSPAFPEKYLKNNAKPESNTNSLDRKIIKNKNLKILKRLSPFRSRKPIEVNIYQINPPKNIEASDLDSQLKKVYSNRGMYAFDEKLKKVVYYPPEYFCNSTKFRQRMDSYGSSLSRSSVDTDSEDLRHISDVAL